jgi:cyclopropane fatty-acyl-phospholipid synthase-like methyltransferase
MTRLAQLSDYVVFVDRKLGERYRTNPMPMETLLEAYLDLRVDIPDMDAFLDARHETVTFSLTLGHLKFLATRMLPETLIHSKSQDERIVRDHYDRGDDFFAAFLGETMVYTSGIFRDRNESLEEAQRNKMDLVCQKLRVRPGDSLLDVGCGWGTLALHAAQHFGADATGVTISEKGCAFGNARIARAGLADRAHLECVDYRAMAPGQYDRIVSLEMVEHVGVKNLAKYFAIVRDRLKDDGLLLLQFCGLRRGGPHGVPPVGMRAEDMIWGLFMNKYVFSGADASLPLSEMVKAMEKAGFEIQSAENMSVHYALTIQRWDENWRAHREAIQKTYGERWYRLWHLFLGWSWRIGQQGTSACYQVVAHKNLDTFGRMALVGLRGESPAVRRAPCSGVAAQ